MDASSMFAVSLCTLCLVIISPTFASSTGRQPRTSYIIHMNVQSMPKVFSDHHNWYLNTLSSVSENRGEIPSHKLIYTYSSSLHGFSATLSPAELDALKESLGFVSCTVDRPLELHTTHTPEFLGLGPALGAWPASRYGEDVIIGFVDTGVWPDSLSFHDEGIGSIPLRWRGACESGMGFKPSSCNRKLIGARFFNKGLLANRPNGTLSMSSGLDTAGHGTHTSSTAAGNFVKGVSYFGYASGTAKGVAPHARIAMYKAVWTHGVYSSDVIAAIDRAIEDGVDVLSLSLGFSSGGSFLGDDPIAVATFAAMEKGLFVAASAGNDGPLHWSLMNGAPWIMTVGAGTIDREFYGMLTLGSGATITFPSLYPGKPFLGPLDIVFMGACDDVPKLESVRGKMIVCKDKLGINAQVEKAMTARVTAAVFITEVSVSEFYTRSSFPAAFVGLRDGQILMDYIQRSSIPKGRLVFQKTRIGTRPAPRVEIYSSRGPFVSCPNILKPDLIAPGTQVLASWAPQTPVGEVKSGSLYSTFNLVTGTSMAAPHVAGAAALVKSVHPDWSPAAIRSALMTTAYLLDNTRTPIKDIANYNLPASPLDIGSGHINLSRALDPGLIYDENPQGYISFLCGMNYRPKQLLAITRSVSHCIKRSLDLNYPSFIAFTDREGSHSGGNFVKEFWRTVTNVGNDRSAYAAKVIGLEGIRVRVEPDRLMFKQKNEKLRYKLTLEGPRLSAEEVVHGSLIWVEDSGRYSASSPIVVTSLVQESPFIRSKSDRQV
ncbi:subtilisin-like protease SBT1.9 [Punica granatum]|uniref:Subtilisin-like protease SBT1.9 n=2 Tax=Punica granatum TaxID=22663 RepID=A0A6P8DXC7_PUNGR|nr:subtilisin-like protease SBT1.9 [Punica granatum]PKI39440.1 hypothetical protein CRG98_040198 [Punica granatum]